MSVMKEMRFPSRSAGVVEVSRYASLGKTQPRSGHTARVPRWTPWLLESRALLVTAVASCFALTLVAERWEGRSSTRKSRRPATSANATTGVRIRGP